MAYRNPFRKISLNEDLCQRLESRKMAEHHYGSLTLYVSQILDWYLEGFLVRSEAPAGVEPGVVTAAKIESKVATHERTKTA